ncbi:hypothetical protein FYJ85_16820 [Victivallaceae bacterium BBE-744-WT-12]|uniref:Uncharacterized protein n=1 Tax=Victivallis lenta TaxID=2606640 RepID=A0A844G6W9_9BACT|nr:hypothetical protein [Victivallis lenta]MST98704.1 hypothetical protein [Victivallis lenta]
MRSNMHMVYIVGLLCLSINLFANRQAIIGENAKDYSIVSTILWKDLAITKDDQNELLRISKTDHDDVASYALIVAATREVPNLNAILQSAARNGGNTSLIAKHFFELKEKGEILEQLEKELHNKPLSLYSAPTPDDFYRDMIVFRLLLSARSKNTEPVIPPGILFEANQSALLKYGWQPERKAFNYIFQLLLKEPKRSDKTVHLIFALSAYSKVFFDEATNAIATSNIPLITKQYLIDYLMQNKYRLSKEQIDKLKKLQMQLQQ